MTGRSFWARTAGIEWDHMAEPPAGAATQAITSTQSHPCVASTSSQSGASGRTPLPPSAMPKWPAYTLRAPAKAAIHHDRECRGDEEREHEQIGVHGVAKLTHPFPFPHAPP